MPRQLRPILKLTIIFILIAAGCTPAPSNTPTIPVPISTLAPSAPTSTPTLIHKTPTTPAGNPMFSVRLMAYNIWLGGGMEPGHSERGDNMNRLNDLVTLVKQANPDVLGLEELNGWTNGNPTIIEQFANAVGMQYFLAPTWRGFNIAIFSKFPILEAENISEYIGNNGALRAVVQTPNGGKLNVVVAHLDPTDQDLRSCEFDKLRVLMTQYQDYPSIIMGDTNSYPNSPDTSYLTQGGWQLAKSIRIDNIFVYSDLAMSGKAICFTKDKSNKDCALDTDISDHPPVGVEITFYDSQNGSRPTPPLIYKTALNCNLDRSPAQPPNDSFNGTKLDETKWRAMVNGGTVTEAGKLIMTTAVDPPSSNARIQSRWQLQGDFDIQVDFQIDESWKAPANDHLDGAYFGVNIGGQAYHITRLRRTGGGNANAFFAWSTDGKLSGETNTNAIAGKYRLVRTGTTLSVQYDIGKGWKELATAQVPVSPVTIYMGNGSVNASEQFTTYFTNFQINSGSAIY